MERDRVIGAVSGADLRGGAKRGDLAPALVPDQPWREIGALGKRLRHEYDVIREDRLWDIVQVGLPPLCAACVRRRSRRLSGIGFMEPTSGAG